MTATCLDAAQVAQVLPFVDIKRIPQSPRGVAGAFNYHGASVPVIDLSELAVGAPAKRFFSTRLILVRYPDRSGRQHLLGLLAEKVTRFVRHAAAEFMTSGVASNLESCMRATHSLKGAARIVGISAGV